MVQMDTEEPLSPGKPDRERVLRVVNAAEKAVLMTNGRCGAEGRGDARMAERFLGIARRRFLLKDWEEARLFSRLAIEFAERATGATRTAPSARDQHGAP